MIRTALLLVAALALQPLPASAQRVPPANAMPLSRILGSFEARSDFGSFREIEWEDDGYREIRYVDNQGRRQRTRVDPITGGAWSRR